MGDLKKTFLAGFLVLFVLLLTPYYLQLIGYQTEDPTNNNEAPIETRLDAETKNEPVFDTTSIPDKAPERSSAGNEQHDFTSFVVQTDQYSAAVSSRGGGSFEEYTLRGQNTYQFLGGYDLSGEYQDSIDVSLILDHRALCAPCVGIIYDNEKIVLDGSFKNTSIPKNSVFSLLPGDSLAVVMQFSHPKAEITKTTTFYGTGYVASHSIQAKDLGSGLEAVFLLWDKGINNTEKNISDELTYSSANLSYSKTIEDFSFSPSSVNDTEKEVLYKEPIDWIAIRNKYFIMAFVPEGADFGAFSASAVELNREHVVPVYSATTGIFAHTLSADLYFGPLDIDEINALETSLDRIMNFGWFIIQPFSRGVLWLLKAMHSFGLNYGVILILIALLVRIITGPLTKKSFQSSLKMQAVQPKLQALQKKHKNDSQRLNQEMVKLYRDNKVNPMGGCFPMLLQMPLLFSLFLVFRSTIEFRGAPFFGWISNLSQPDTIFYLPVNIPIYGDQVAFLPILLGISMFLTQKMSMATMDAKQKPMMYIMTAFFFLLFNSFPSGLNLYYLIYNILNYLQQKSLKRA